MGHSWPAEADLSQLYSQLAAELAQARSREAAAGACLAMIEAQLSPRRCQLVWGSGQQLQVLGADADVAPLRPDPPELNLLREGKLALRASGEATTACFAPLRARAELLGWLYVEQPAWGVESPALLSTLAGLAAPALALLEAAGRRDDRVAQLRTLNEIGRLLSGVLDLDTLLEAIYSATRRLVDAPVFYIAFYEPANDQFDLTYAVQDGVRCLFLDRAEGPPSELVHDPVPELGVQAEKRRHQPSSLRG